MKVYYEKDSEIDLIKSKNEGAIKFWLIIFSNPLPKLVIIKLPAQSQTKIQKNNF